MRRLTNVLTATALCFAMIGFSGCGSNDNAITPGDVSEGEVPSAQSVTVSGTFEKQLDQRSFTMSGTAEIFSDNLVVVNRTDLPVLNQGDEIEVTGTVHNVGRVEIERQTGWNFNPQIVVELEDVKGYLVADSVRVIERD